MGNFFSRNAQTVFIVVINYSETQVNYIISYRMEGVSVPRDIDLVGSVEALSVMIDS